MGRKILLFFLFIHLCSGNGIARVIRGENPADLPATLHGFGVYIYEKIAEGKLPERFTRQDVINLTGWSYLTVYRKTILLEEIGILEVWEGRPNYYSLKSPFDKRENLELLSVIEELHKGSYDAEERAEIVPIIKEKIEIIKQAMELAAKEELNVQLSPELREEFPLIKMKFFIGIVGQNLIDLYKSFTSIKITKSEYPPPQRVDIDYNPAKDEIIIILPGYPFRIIVGEKVSPEAPPYDPMWNWLGSEFIRRELVYAVITGDLKLEVNGTPAQKIFYNLLFSSQFIIRTATLTSDFALLERFIMERNEPVIKPLFQEFISVYKEILQLYLEALGGILTEKEWKILSLRYGLKDGKPRTLKEVASIFNITRERVRMIEIKALEKLRRLYLDITPYKARIEEILQKVYNIFYPE